MPDAFDDWPVAKMERELEIYAAILADGEYPLTVEVFVEVLRQAFGGS